MKKTIIIIIVGLVIATAVLSVFHFAKPRQAILSEAFSAVPLNSSLIVEINEFGQFFEALSENKIYRQIFCVESLDLSNSMVHQIYNISNQRDVIASICEHSSLLVSFHILGKDKLEQLIITPVSPDMNDKSAAQAWIKYFEESGAEINKREYDNSVIYELISQENNKNFSFTVHKGLFICSASSLFVESSIRQIENATSCITDNLDFNAVHQTAGKNELANIYINKSNFAGMIEIFTDSDIHSSINSLKYFGTWTELDMIINKDNITLNGFSYISDSIDTFLSVLESQSSNAISSTQILPDGTAAYLALSVNNIVRYDQLLSRYLSSTGGDKKREDRIKEIKNQTNVDLRDSFFPLVSSEVCYAVTNVNNLDIYQNAFVIVGIKSKSQAENTINNLLKLAAKKMETSYYDMIDEVSIDESSKIKIYRMPFSGTGELLFGPLFKQCRSEYVTFIDNFMVFANNKEALYSLVHNAVLNRTLETSISHNKFLDNFSSRSNMFIYFSSYAGSGLIKNALSNSFGKLYDDNLETFANIGSFGFQLTKSRSMMYNNIVIKHTEEVNERPQTVWESRLLTNIDMKPEIVTNHNNDAREIIVQDIENNLYLLSGSGRELWQIELDEKITSRIYQVDYYKNNRLQYLFSTENKLHLIDRLGNYVERYPLSLRAKSTAPLALFDYHDNRDYRIFIPCEDNRVYLYNLEGNLISGWTFEETENVVNSPVSYYNHNNKDYIVFNDDYKAYILSRRGEHRVEAETDFEFSKNNRIWHDTGSEELRFIATDSKGTVKIINSEGKVTSIEIKEFSENHFFLLEDINRNGKNEFVFLDKKSLEVYTQNKQLLFKYDFNSEPEYEPSFYFFPRNQIKIGVVCKAEGKIYLLNQNGTLFNGFPLHGRSLFSIGYLSSSSNKFNLIVGGPENLLYNYEVNEN